jgi:hypothetical protein
MVDIGDRTDRLLAWTFVGICIAGVALIIAVVLAAVLTVGGC